MIKRLLASLLALILVFSLVSCKSDNTNKPNEVDKNFFRQTTYSNGHIVFGPTGKEHTFYSNDYDEIISAFNLLEDGYKLDEITYAFNYDGDAYTVSYIFFMNPKSLDFNPESILSLSACIPAASFIRYQVSIFLG